ncbi:MAG: hypothetical protein ACTS3F_14445 [Phycisphaerales bacterium]
MQHTFSIRRTLTLAIAAFIGLLAVAAPANAQFRMGMMNVDNPDFTSEELARYARLLNLTEAQRDAASGMLDAYLAEFTIVRNEWQRIRDGARDEFRESRDPGVWQELQTVVAEVQEKKQKLETTFLEDYRLLLTPEQDLKWEDLERLRRRERTLPNGGIISGETVDLIRVVEDTELSPAARDAINPMLDTYARELDRVLIERNRVYESGMARGMELWRTGDFETINKLLEDGSEQAKRVRDVHLRFVRQMEAALPEADRGAIEQAFNREAYPQVYRESVAASAMDAASGFDDLTDDQRQRLQDIRFRHDREVTALNDRWRTAIDRAEENRSVMDFMGGGGRDPEMRIARQARRDFDNKILEEVRSVLTEDQQARLPAPEAPRDWRRGPDFERSDDDRQGSPRGPGRDRRRGPDA